MKLGTSAHQVDEILSWHERTRITMAIEGNMANSCLQLWYVEKSPPLICFWLTLATWPQDHPVVCPEEQKYSLKFSKIPVASLKWWSCDHFHWPEIGDMKTWMCWVVFQWENLPEEESNVGGSKAERRTEIEFWWYIVGGGGSSCARSYPWASKVCKILQLAFFVSLGQFALGFCHLIPTSFLTNTVLIKVSSCLNSRILIVPLAHAVLFCFHIRTIPSAQNTFHFFFLPSGGQNLTSPLM